MKDESKSRVHAIIELAKKVAEWMIESSTNELMCQWELR